MNEEWISIENKLRFICLDYATDLDFGLLITTLKNCLIRLLANKIGFNTDKGIYEDAKSSLDKSIVLLIDKYCTEDEINTLYKLREFVNKNL